MAQVTISGLGCASLCSFLRPQGCERCPADQACIDGSHSKGMVLPLFANLRAPERICCSGVGVKPTRAYSSTSTASASGRAGVSILGNTDSRNGLGKGLGSGSVTGPSSVIEDSSRELATGVEELELTGSRVEESEPDYEAVLNDVIARLSDDSGAPLRPDWQAGVWLAPRKRVGVGEEPSTDGSAVPRKRRQPIVEERASGSQPVLKHLTSNSEHDVGETDEMVEEEGLGRVGQTISAEAGTSGSTAENGAASPLPGSANKSRDVWIRPGSKLAHSRLPEQKAAAKVNPRKEQGAASKSALLVEKSGEAGENALLQEDIQRSVSGEYKTARELGGAIFRTRSSRAGELQKNVESNPAVSSDSQQTETLKQSESISLSSTTVESPVAPKNPDRVLSDEEKALKLGMEALQATNEWLKYSVQRSKSPESGREGSVNQRVKRTVRMFNVQGSGRQQQGGIQVKPRKLARKLQNSTEVGGNSSDEGFSDSEAEDEGTGMPGVQKAEKGSAFETARDVVVKVASAAAIAAGQIKSPAFPMEEPPKKLKINLDLAIYRGRTLVFKRQFSQAETIFRKCIQDFPEDGRAYCQLAKLMERRGDLDGAREMYETAEAVVRGNNAYVWQMYAVLEERAGNLKKARDLFDAALVVNKAHAAAWHGWGLLEKRDGNLAKAKSLFLKGLKNCPTNAYLHQELALMEKEAGNLEQAREYFERGTRYAPRSAALWQAWALLEADAEDTDKARELFEKARDASPRSGPVYLAWALFEARCGETRAAHELFEKGLLYRPRDVVLMQAFARFLYEEGDPARARLLFQRSTALDPKHQPSWQAWAIMEWREGDVSKSRELFQKGIWAAPRGTSVAKVFQAWGVLEQREGNLTVARELYKCALKADPTSVQSWQSWAMLEENSGNIFRADELRRLCIEQQTEVVSVDLSLTEVLAPAFSKIREWFNFKDKVPLEKQLKAARPMAERD